MIAALRRLPVDVRVAAGAAIAVAMLGGLATQLGPWYYNLAQPPWKPPDWAFGPAWTLIYTLTAIAAVRSWRAAGDGETRRRVAIVFGVNAVFNVLWSVLFFTLRRPDFALAEAVPFWLSIAALIVVALPLSRRTAWLLMPYLVWVAYAVALNAAVVSLNGPFGAA